MPAIVDFSSAFPWLGGGFLAGLFCYWLLRLTTGVDRRRAGLLTAAQLALDDERRASAEHASLASRIDGERQRLTAELNQVSPRAGLVPQLERQLAEFRQSEASRHEQVTAAETEIATLRHNAETNTRAAKYFEGEFNRLFAEHDQLTKSAQIVTGELQTLKANI
jgi:chromosome segregation ATPase